MIADQEFSRARQEPTVFTHAFELEAYNEQPKHGPTTGRMAWQATTSSSARASDSFVDSHAWDYVVVSRHDTGIAVCCHLGCVLLKIAAISCADRELMYEDQADTLRGYQRALFKGSPEETPEATARSSPISYVDAVSAPLLVIQGSHDTRCPPRQMIAYEEKMKAAGKDITIEWFEAGHGSGNHHQFNLLAWIN